MEALIAHMTAHYPIDSGNIDRVGVLDGGLGVVAYRLHSGRGT